MRARSRGSARRRRSGTRAATRRGDRGGGRLRAGAHRRPAPARSARACPGRPSCATTAPSRNSTQLCTMLVGWMATSIDAYGVSKRKCASMISEPLVHHRRGVDRHLRAHVPGGVRERLSRRDRGERVERAAQERTAAGGEHQPRAPTPGSSPRRHCQSAECSLSIGMMRAPAAAARALTSSPAMTRTSLVAVATVAPASIAASVGRRAAAPVIATQTTSASMAAISQAASMPTAQPGRQRGCSNRRAPAPCGRR